VLQVGIEDLNVFGGSTYLDADELASYRNLDKERFSSLLIKGKSVALHYEDPITYAVNAAKPIIDRLSEEDKNSIELVITCTESGIDFGKSLSTYVHEYLGLSRVCRMFEIKQACYSGVAGLQTAVSYILSQASPNAKALVIASDITRFMLHEEGETNQDWSFAEPSGGSGAVAMLISSKPYVFQIDVGASGFYGYEVMDTCRPQPESGAGDADLSLLSYLDCCEQTFLEYRRRVGQADYRSTFDYLAYHTPFGGMVKGAHRTMMRKMTKSDARTIESDFVARVMPGLDYCQKVGNIMGASMLLSLASTIELGEFNTAKRIGCFSYGSGCSSEFFSGVVRPQSQKVLKNHGIGEHLKTRYQLNMDEYHDLLHVSNSVKFGTQNTDADLNYIPSIYQSVSGKGRLYLTAIRDFKRIYEWV